MEFFDSKNRFHASDNCHLVDRLGQIFNGSGFESDYYILCFRLRCN